MKKSSFISLASCASLVFSSCVWLPRNNEASADIDLFAPDIVRQLLKEPVIIPGLMLHIEVTAGGIPVVPRDTKIVSLRNDITMPLIGEVDCSGLTLRMLSEKLTEEYEKLYNAPSVMVTFVGGDSWGTVGVYGRVGREGPVNMPATGRLTLTRAVQEAGGLTPIANRKRIQVTRTAGPEDLPQLAEPVQKTKIFSYDDISSGRISDPLLVKEDVVHVPETFF